MYWHSFGLLFFETDGSLCSLGGLPLSGDRVVSMCLFAWPWSHPVLNSEVKLENHDVIRLYLNSPL